MNPPSQPSTPDTSLSLALRTDLKGPAQAHEPVRQSDLSEITSEAWRDGCLRRGRPDKPLSDISITLEPTASAQGRLGSTGFNLEVTRDLGQSTLCLFSVYSLSHVARRAANRLVTNGVWQAGQQFFYEILENQSASSKRATPIPTSNIKTTPLTYLQIPLNPLKKIAKAHGDVSAEIFPVFYTAKALAQAERCSRLGDREQPPVETGGVLIGSLASCPETGEFFPLITDVLEVQEAEEKTFSLSYSSKSYQRIQTILAAMQESHPEQQLRILGQTHGHNFLPNNGITCQECPKLPVCSLSSAVISEDDISWSRAIFAHQPWGLCHIFGLTARSDAVNNLYSLKDGTWKERGYFILPELNLDPWTTQS